MRHVFHYFLAITILSICSYLGYEALRIYNLVESGSQLSLNAQKYERVIEGENEVLILGDSLAYGVGVSTPEKSFAGALSHHHIDESIINNSVIGETIKSLDSSVEDKVTKKYNHIYVIVGGNDIMRMHINIFESKNRLGSLAHKLSQKADEVTLITTGNFDHVDLAPWAMRGVFSWRANQIHQKALELEKEIENLDYVDFYSIKYSASEYKSLEADDGYHLNDYGIETLVATMLEQ